MSLRFEFALYATSALILARHSQPDEFLAGAFANKDNVHDPALKFLHGTTTLGFVFSKGIIISVDSRASMGNYIGESKGVGSAL